MPPGEYSEAVLVLAKLLLYLRPQAFALTFQHDEDGLLAYLQQVQKTLSENKHIQAVGDDWTLQHNAATPTSSGTNCNDATSLILNVACVNLT